MEASPVSRYVAAYDISNPSRRAAVARILQRYGKRAQWSVFEIHVSPEELPVFKRAVGRQLGQRDDFELFPIDMRCPARRIRWQRSPKRFTPVRVVG